jgi:hypothetical protein
MQLNGKIIIMTLSKGSYFCKLIISFGQLIKTQKMKVSLINNKLNFKVNIQNN